MKAVRYHKQGGPEVMQCEDVATGDSGQGQVRIRHTAIGVNFVDTYQRSGLYPMQLPAVADNEAAGIVEAVGAGAADLKAGDRVCAPQKSDLAALIALNSLAGFWRWSMFLGIW